MWRIFLAPLLLLLAGLGWSAFWFYAAGETEAVVDRWRDREAKSGREYGCGARDVAGYPFRFELSCAPASIGLTSMSPPARARLDRLRIVAQVYDPGLLIAEFSAPMTVGGGDMAGQAVLTWKLAQASLRGAPEAPQRASLVVDDLAAAAPEGAAWARAGHLELHGRPAADALPDKPALDLALRLQSASAPALHALAAEPFDADIEVTLRGLHDLAPKPWPQRLRDIQAADGRIEVRQARVRQGDLAATASGALAIDAAGHLKGELNLVVAGIEKVIAPLGLEALLAKTEPQTGLPGLNAGDVNSLIGALDSIVPGLGNIARRGAGAGVAAALNALGKPAELDGRSALALPLRFADGAIYLGPLQVGRTAALF